MQETNRSNLNVILHLKTSDNSIGSKTLSSINSIKHFFAHVLVLFQSTGCNRKGYAFARTEDVSTGPMEVAHNHSLAESAHKLHDLISICNCESFRVWILWELFWETKLEFLSPNTSKQRYSSTRNE